MPKNTALCKNNEFKVLKQTLKFAFVFIYWLYLSLISLKC